MITSEQLEEIKENSKELIKAMIVLRKIAAKQNELAEPFETELDTMINENLDSELVELSKQMDDEAELLGEEIF
jgi:hypothetical protein